jgi:prepilin-type N-terminal cleavage/methylation domain-containing protein
VSSRGEDPVPSVEAASKREAGYSLLEILVSLGILSLVSTITVVNGIRMVENMTERSAVQKIIETIETARYIALTRESSLVLDPAQPGQPAWLDLPEDWTLIPDQPIVFSKSGVCSGGRLTIRTARGQDHVIYAEAPDCRVRDR